MSPVPGKSPVHHKTEQQRRQALLRANEVRSARKHLKEQLRRGEVDLATLVADPPAFLGSARISDLVQALPGYGPTRTAKVLSACRVSASKTMAGLSPRQRRELADALTR